MADGRNDTPQASRILPCYLKAAEDGLISNAVMLCEVVGDEIQSISLRVAADAMTRWSDLSSALRPENS